MVATMIDFDSMTQGERDLYAWNLEREWHLNCVPGVKGREEHHIVVVPIKAAELWW
jgi:hypothetical protein